ncbi:hypothetical protein LOTGIDRAFT_174200 [Lottia gigantea]|uniref:CCHC-type domain-containing protein n=1 Tax=Lottia gigantea TaxID=225164 RepID=V4C9V2_LOTGI|nr:hypothetical protein LOTGIDRAFT_174200 [Lottia gigantea]ESO98554.1 hypothetical protein LOTGIDRAFT_174200 [Lottia gigantea]
MPEFYTLVDTARRLSHGVSISSGNKSTTSDPIMSVRCTYCKKLGHTLNRCRLRKNSVSNEKSGRTKTDDWTKNAKCYVCGKRGHISKTCYQAKKPVHHVNFNQTCPTKDVTVGKLTSSATVDSGAAVTCTTVPNMQKAFPGGYDMESCSSVLTGPSGEQIPTLGVINTYVQIDGHTVPARIHIIDSEEDIFLIGWDIISKFHKVTISPASNSVDFGLVVENSECVSEVRAVTTTVVPPRSQKILRVQVSHPSPSDSGLLVERLTTFEDKSGLFVGRCVSNSKTPLVLLMNPDSISKTVYASQQVACATALTISATSEKEPINSVEEKSWNIGPINSSYKSKLLDLLGNYKPDVFTGLGCAKKHSYELKLAADADLSKVRGRRLKSNPRINQEIESQVKSMLDSNVIEPVTRGQVERQSIIERAHSLGHFSAQRTLAKLVNSKITLSEVQDFVGKCKTCITGPHAIPRSPHGMTKTALRPWDIVHCDFVGPLPRSTNGFEYIFTFMDDLTRFVIAWPLRVATTYTAISVLDRLFSQSANLHLPFPINNL